MVSEAKQLYYQWFERAQNPFLYMSPWWLDATCQDGTWEVLAAYYKQQVVSLMPCMQTRIRGLSAIITPHLTQWVSFLSAPADTENIGPVSLPEIPKRSIIDLSIKPVAGFPEPAFKLPHSVKYSYIIPAAEEADVSRANYNEGLKRNLRQAEDSYYVEQSDDIGRFISLCKNSYTLQGIKAPPWFDEVTPAVFLQIQKRAQGVLLFAFLKGQVVAGIMLAWDQSTCYYLAGGRVADEPGASAHALLLDHAIQMAQKKKWTFDFEGSMNPGIANFFHSFGAVPVPYWQIKKYTGAGLFWKWFHP